MKIVAKIIFSVCLASASAIALGDSIELDSTFGISGITTISTGDVGSGAYGVAIQSDGRIVAVGYSSDRNYINRFAIARFSSDGTLDSSFGTNGIALTSVGLNGSASAVAIQSDGKIVVAGHSVVDRTSSGFTLVRYNPDGKLDQTFGKEGIVVPTAGINTGRASTIAIQRDRKILVGGGINVGGFDDFALARYNPDGTHDNTFGRSGLVVTSIDKAGDSVASIAIQSDEKIVAVGTVLKNAKNQLALARYQSTGALDATFGTGGVITLAIGGGSSSARAVILQPDGRIIAIGDSSTDPTEKYKYTPVISLAGFTANGNLDPLFGKEGIVTTPPGRSTSATSAAARQSDGKIVVVGNAVKSVTKSDYLHSFLVARYGSDGALDSTFGEGGAVVTEIGSGPSVANALAIQSDGKIVAAGYLRSGPNSEFALVRYLPKGEPPNRVRTDF